MQELWWCIRCVWYLCVGQASLAVGLHVEAVQADVFPGRGSTPAGLILLQLGQRQCPHRVHKHFLISVSANRRGGNIDVATLYTAGLVIFYVWWTNISRSIRRVRQSGLQNICQKTNTMQIPIRPRNLSSLSVVSTACTTWQPGRKPELPSPL